MTTVERQAAPAWSNANFRRLWRGSAASTLGAEIGEIALPLLALLTLSATPAEVSILRIAQFLPFLVAALPVGLLVDRLRHARLRLMVGADVGRAMLLALVAVAALAGFATMPALYAAVFAVAVCTVVFQVADFAVLPSVVAPAQLVDANGKLSATQSGSEIAGRGLGGVLVQLLSAPGAVLLNAFGYVASALSLGRIRLDERPPETGPQPPAPSWREAVQGIRVTLRHRYIRPLLGEATTFNVGNEMFLLGLLLYAVRDLDLSPVAIGAVFTASGVGSFLGAWFGSRVTARFGYGRVLLISLIVGNGAPLAVLATPHDQALSVLAAVFLLMGTGIGVANVHAVALRQSVVPEEQRGRVNAAYRVISWGAIPVGAALGGFVATQAGPFPAMATGAVAVCAATIWVAWSAVPRLRTIHEAVDDVR
jgi:predicted MFS family arabinose efflux permease